MKKFFNDNLWLMVIIALAVAGYALYRATSKKSVKETIEATVTPAE